MQILVPIQEHNEFDFNILLIVERLLRDTAYIRMSREAYNRDPDAFVVTRSIACFERTFVSGQSRYDRYFFKETALTMPAKRGMNLFFRKKPTARSAPRRVQFYQLRF